MIYSAIMALITGVVSNELYNVSPAFMYRLYCKCYTAVETRNFASLHSGAKYD
ncbi:MAG: hypothetical protein KME64_07425 [Scytonematopsis contorta HA4267-MV1]|jgi:hypothetical protein|nr:hypothetical protein [Scytonematopsis contorta HA4267-MV1]